MIRAPLFALALAAGIVAGQVSLKAAHNISLELEAAE